MDPAIELKISKRRVVKTIRSLPKSLQKSSGEPDLAENSTYGDFSAVT